MCETQLIEQYLFNTLSHEEKLLLDAKLLLDKDLRKKLFFQKQTYTIVQQHARKQLRLEIEKVHHLMFTENRFQNFRNTISNIFKK